jgi:hypothetical protein
VGFKPGIICSVGGRDDHYNTPPGVDVMINNHDFLRFLTIFGEKIGVFPKTNVMIEILHYLPLF